MVRHRLGVGDHAALSCNHPVGVIEPIACRARITTPRQGRELVERAVGELGHVVEVERALRRDALRVAVLVLHDAEHRRMVDVEQLGDATAALAEHEALRRRRRLDDVGRVAEKGSHELALGESHRLDDVAREKAVLRDDARIQRQLGDTVRDQVEIRGLLDVLGEQLEEPGVIDRVIVVVSRVHVERVLRDGARGDVQHVRETFSHGRVQRLVHVDDALAAREVRGTEPGHAHARGDRGGGVLALGLEEQQLPAVDVALPFGDRSRPALAHLCRGRDGIGTRGLARGRLHGHDRRASVHRLERAWKSRGGVGDAALGPLGCSHRSDHVELPMSCGAMRAPRGGPCRSAGRVSGVNCAPVSHTIAPVGQRSIACSSARSFSA